ncbi:hypothetical protein RchiOBHm_Chr7g0224391 [Rosa chinensis]|uniref:Uncharacterized protein n=1 Tax=Rosa chinensis TaxID=74649 RepID=A0A2P6PDU3_ROSCH|nr:hypothetical protein RchiOBHm_Chr7g0224391 [Rosa chinensis]
MIQTRCFANCAAIPIFGTIIFTPLTERRRPPFASPLLHRGVAEEPRSTPPSLFKRVRYDDSIYEKTPKVQTDSRAPTPLGSPESATLKAPMSYANSTLFCNPLTVSLLL